MRPLTGMFTTELFPELIVGLGEPDDAAVYRLDNERAIISTMDFFPPVVDDPYAFGAIAAANALSDVYAMGGTPLFAINLVAFPDGLGMALLTEILRGGAEKVREAGAAIAGGHTVTDKEPKYGLAVTGIVHPARIVTKGGAQPGDVLVLTKPLGTGVITTALKSDLAASADVAAAVAAMMRLNRTAAQQAVDAGAHAMTDITGYGLIGHAHEMAYLSRAVFTFNFAQLPWLPGAFTYAKQDVFPGGMIRNALYYEQWVDADASLQVHQLNLLYDPQTSGGLLIALPETAALYLVERLTALGEPAAVVGSVKAAADEQGGRIQINP